LELIHHTLPLPEDDYTQFYFKDNTGFFDIETTGFSSKSNFVYLIGLIVRQMESMEIYQFFAENRREECRILNAFHEKLKDVHTLIHFNGTGFDIPFLKQREHILGLSFSWEDYATIDLYKTTAPLAGFLHLPDRKQKTLEAFLNISRKDTYTGGELIHIYRQYEKKPEESAKSLLLLHNYEDILGMTKLLPILSYSAFFHMDTPRVKTASLEEVRPYGASLPEKELQVTLEAPLPFPKQIFTEKDFFRIVCWENCAYLFIPVLEGELRFYYDNYKDYYYLPQEDMAVHKSLASFVDKSHRTKATAGTCYTRRKGLFLPQRKNWFSPCFYPGKKQELSYFEYQEGFLNDSKELCLYIKNILSLCIIYAKPSI